MTPEQYERVEALYGAMLDLPRSEHAAYLDGHCDDPLVRARVEAMLGLEDHHRAALEEPAIVHHLLSTSATSADEPIPQRIGQYTIIREIGRGGMGVVYEASQPSPQRRVALKVIRPGSFSKQMTRRFEFEAHVLGQLHHPAIAHIYESGLSSDDGEARPFFAMELIDGSSLRRFVRSAHLSPSAILELMAQIADGVHHAHQKGVIHRDLKPDNILIDAGGQPKILDFGVARAADVREQMATLHTDAGQIIGTLAYMSPEQVAGHSDALDTRSDVYALGAITYELLTGSLPLDVTRESVATAIRMIQEDEPRRLSQWNAGLRGDVETIVGKAMEKDRTRRYQSAAEFATDLRRHLRNEPILARPATALYQLRKFVSRNTALTAGVLSGLFLLVAGLTASTALYLRANANLERAVLAEEESAQEAAVASEVSRFLVSLFEISDPALARGRDITARDMLDRGAVRIAEELETTPPVRGRLMHVMGDVYHKLGYYDSARPLITESLALHASLYPAEHPLLLGSRHLAARMHLMDGDLTEARVLVEAGLEAMEAQANPDAELKWQFLNILSAVANREGDFDEALTLNEQSVALAESIADPGVRRTLLPRAHHALAVSNYYLNQFDRAERAYRMALAGFRDLHGDQHPSVSFALSALGLALQSLGRLDEAERTLQEAIAIGEVIWGADNVNLTGAINNLALVLERLGRTEEAEVSFRRLVTMYEASYGAEHAITALGLANLGSLLTDTGQFEEAERLLNRSHAMRSTLLGPDHPDTVAGNNLLGTLYEVTGRWPKAEDIYRDSHAWFADRDGATALRTLRMLGSLARTIRAQQRQGEAIDLCTQQLDLLESHHGFDTPLTTAALFELADLHLTADNAEQAQTLLQTFHAKARQLPDQTIAEEIAARAIKLFEQYQQDDLAETWRKSAPAP